MKKIILSTLLAFVGYFLVNAQTLRWVSVDAEFAPLPSSVKVYESTDSLAGKPNRCFAVVIDIANPLQEITTQVGQGKRFTPSQYYAQNAQPLIVTNGTFFSFADNRNLNVVVRNGKMEAYNVVAVKGKNDTVYRYVTRGAFGIDKRGKPAIAWLFTDSSKRYPMAFEDAPLVATGLNANPPWRCIEQLINFGSLKAKSWKMKTAIGGGPVLIHNGKIKITNKEELMFVNGLLDKHPRTAIGYTLDRKVILFAVEGRHPGVAEGMTLQQVANALLSLGCHEALNLDGGGSSCLLINGKNTITPSDKEGQRPVPAVLMVQQRNSKN